ncbi:MAG: hypothetical protein ACK41D_11150 [Rubricoccaceae bacterium]
MRLCFFPPAFAAVLLFAASLADAQPALPNHAARPVAGTLGARPGVVSMQDLTVRPGLDSPLPHCPGEIRPDAPDVVVDWRGGAPLRLTTRAARDLALLVRLPDGSWRCDDDTENLQPVVEIADAPRGRYAVWVGAFGLSDQDPPVRATLYAGLPRPALAPAGRPTGGELRLAAGFEATSGARTVEARIGGPDWAGQLVNPDEDYCTGFVDGAQPTLRFTYSGTGQPLYLHATPVGGDDDLVMLVQNPDGLVACYDDDLGADPVFGEREPVEGTYTVWVGTFAGQARSASPRARLTLGEAAPEGFDLPFFGTGGFAGFGAIPFSEGTYRPLDVNAPPRHRLTLGAGDAEVRLAAEVTAVVPNPVQGDACRASLGELPVADLYVAEPDVAEPDVAAGGLLSIYASASADGVLLVRTPSGRWFCSDDASGLNPGVEFEAPEAGTYRVWLGAFVTDTPIAFTLVADRNPLAVSEQNFDFGSGTSEFHSAASYEGAQLRPSEPEATFAQGARSYRETLAATSASELPNPAEGFACVGHVGARPQAALERVGGGPLTLIARADDADLVMLVRAPDGQWYCSDDAEGTNPAVQLGDAPDGTYAIWIGTFSVSSQRHPATLEARRGQLDD